MHDLSVISTLAGGLAAALVLGWLTQRLGLSTLVGYMVAGILVGPYTPGFVADTKLAAQMAEIGVILLMFGVGMHFHPQELLRVWRLAVPGAIAQSVVATIAGWAFARAFGWSHAAGFVFGMALAVASTVVLMRMLVDQNRLATQAGHVAVGWLIVEDMFTVVALVVLPVLALGGDDVSSFGIPLAKALAMAAAFVGLVWIVGSRVAGQVMERMARTGSAELFTLAVFVLALGIAFIAAEGFHVSVALGAFFAGLVVGQSRFGPQASGYMTPFRDVFTALFFVSVGMLFDPRFVVEQPLMVLAALLIVLIVKPLIALVIVLVLRGGRETAATVAVGLSQIGEFSFILASLGLSLKVLPAVAFDALVVTAIFSIAVNPILFRLLRRSEPSAPAPVAAAGGDRPVVVSGSGELARRVIARCARESIASYAVSAVLDAQDALREAGAEVVFGRAEHVDVLRAAHLERAETLVVTDDALADKLSIIRAARSINPRIAIVVAAANKAERAWLIEFGATLVTDEFEGVTDAMMRSIRQTL